MNIAYFEIRCNSSSALEDFVDDCPWEHFADGVLPRNIPSEVDAFDATSCSGLVANFPPVADGFRCFLDLWFHLSL